jgi:tripartite-type tricarboxylate transporter receptor subunit TctC
MAYLNSQAGLDLVHVTYRSGAEMLTALLREDADVGMISVSTSLGQIKEGKVRALAGASARPMQQLPDTPSAAQTIPGFDLPVWHGIVGPAGMDSELVVRMNGIFNQTLQDPAVRAAITGPQAGEIVGGTPQQFDTFIKSELRRWPEVVKAAGIKTE